MKRFAGLGWSTFAAAALVACGGGTDDAPPSGELDGSIDYDSTIGDDAGRDSTVDAMDARDTRTTEADTGLPPRDAPAFDTTPIDLGVVDVGIDTGPATCSSPGAPACASTGSLGTCGDAGLVTSGSPCGATTPSCFAGTCKAVWAYAVGDGTSERLGSLVAVGGDQFVGVGAVARDSVWMVKIDADGTVLGQRSIDIPRATGDDVSFDHAVATNAPGGLVVAGGINGPTKSRAFVLKVNASDLTVTKSVIFDAPAGYPEGEGISTLTKAGTGYLVAGGSAGPSSGKGGMWVARLDEDLTMTLNRTIRVSATLSDKVEAGTQMIPFGTGFLVVGNSLVKDAAASSGYSSAAAVVRLGPTFDVDVANSGFYPLAHANDYDESFYRAVDVGDGVVIIGGSIRPGTTGDTKYELTLLKLRTDGTIAWQTRLGSPNGGGFAEAIRSKDDHLLIVGSNLKYALGSPTVAWVAKLDGRTGAVLFDQVIDLGSFSQNIQGVAETSTGDLILGGSFEFGASDFDFLRIPASGSPSMGTAGTSTSTTISLTPQAYVAGTNAASVTSAPLTVTSTDRVAPRTLLYPRP